MALTKSVKCYRCDGGGLYKNLGHCIRCNGRGVVDLERCTWLLNYYQGKVTNGEWSQTVADREIALVHADIAKLQFHDDAFSPGRDMIVDVRDNMLAFNSGEQPRRNGELIGKWARQLSEALKLL